MVQRSDPTAAMFAAIREFVSTFYPGEVPDYIEIHLANPQRKAIMLPLALNHHAVMSRQMGDFLPGATQIAILEALENRALRTDALARESKVDRRSIFKKPGGIAELQEHGLVENDSRLGYFRPDAPPQEMPGMS